MGGGANTTDPSAATVHGTNPQFLVHNILRQRVYECAWWKEHCFALSAETLVDKAMQLEYFAGAYGNIRKPSPFLCLVLKMLQIQVSLLCFSLPSRPRASHLSLSPSTTSSDFAAKKLLQRHVIDPRIDCR